ncbi:pimeloyl-ACP methyl ester carboxylesterase [Halopolyspora algeriensis]|uniref:Pimeloyl-ACP methyl ester carboxylesterase n=1 Tax=Halopolyspora algeriensis TaxID=1500506 RepID=A0A368W2Q5_9ACTN|nr:alpha/beta hydrolase [Halopolyspora algeriensis]RCW46258.1 pimeloyl-ACP methyl ester carboxylesterase [Halopolyspora algeriensis]TQM55660.1 pimeloyl-ACP methyl ester carboxylesterase [Halopolyspora algeriensis]
MTGWGRPEFTASAGTRVHAAVLGPADAPDLVCVHGWGCSHRYFGPLARRLSGRFRVVAVDLPGFGSTLGPAEPLDVRGLSTALGDWMRATGRGGAALVGNSAGCQVIADLAVHSPELLGPVVLSGPSVDRRARSYPRQFGRILVDMRWERVGLTRLLVRDYLRCGPRRLRATARFLLADPVERKLGHIRTPAVVVRGSRDTIVPRAWTRECTALLPQGYSAEIPGAGHILNYSAPAELARITCSLLDRTGSEDR